MPNRVYMCYTYMYIDSDSVSRYQSWLKYRNTCMFALLVHVVTDVVSDQVLLSCGDSL